MPRKQDPRDRIPDVRDGLTRIERIVFTELQKLQDELGDRSVPTASLYARVLAHVDLRPEELSEILARLGARKR